MMMKLLRKLAVGGLLLGWFATPNLGHAASCATTLQSLHGWYGMLVSGVNSDLSLKYLAGAVLFDGAGNVTGSHVYSSSTGTSSSVTGTYSVNTDCSITLLLTFGTAAQQTYAVGVRSSTNEAVGIEVDAIGVATIDLQAQYATYTTGLNFTNASANGTFAANCISPSNSDVNLETFLNGALTGTAAFNDNGAYALSGSAYTGTYTVNSDGTFTGSLSFVGNVFDFFGVLSNSNQKIQYFYSLVVNGATTGGFSVCNGSLAPTATGSFSIAAGTSAVSVAQGATGTDAITVTPVNGFTGSVGFTASGLPAGVTAAFNPASSTAGSTLTFTVGATAVAGTYPITVIGTSGAITQTTPVSLSVTAGSNFALAATSPLLIAVPGAAVGDVIKVVPVSGFTGAVSFAASGLPSGVTAAFNPASATNATTATFTVASTTAAGSYPITIGGTSGASTQTAAITLIVANGPSFTLNSSLGSVNVTQGKTGADAVTVAPANGFTGTVAFSVSGLPAGVTAAFSPNSSTTGTSVTFTAAASAAAGSYPLTINGTSGGLSAKAAVTLVIATPAPSFTLSANPSSGTLARGQTGSAAITLTALNGFSATVTYSITGLPTGTTASLSPTSGKAGTTVTAVISTSTPAGTYNLVITGTSPGSGSNPTITASTTIKLTIS